MLPRQHTTKGAFMRISHLLLAGLMLAGAPTLVRAADWDGGDADAGKTVFAKCALCHSPEQGKTKIGPSLFGVVGRTAGTLAGYTYSDAMKSYGKVWTPENLFNYLANPRAAVPGTKMAFVGLPDATDRKNVIAYLQTLK